MKKLGKLKLNNLTDRSMDENEMKELKGGQSCDCGCCYEDSGGSSTFDNAMANCQAGLNSTCGSLKYVYC